MPTSVKSPPKTSQPLFTNNPTAPPKAIKTYSPPTMLRFGECRIPLKATEEFQERVDSHNQQLREIEQQFADGVRLASVNVDSVTINELKMEDRLMRRHITLTCLQKLKRLIVDGQELLYAMGTSWNEQHRQRLVEMQQAKETAKKQLKKVFPQLDDNQLSAKTNEAQAVKDLRLAVEAAASLANASTRLSGEFKRRIEGISEELTQYVAYLRR